MLRLDDLAERAGSRTWAMFVGPPELGVAYEAQERRLLHALSSVPIAASASIALWHRGTLGVSRSRVVVAHGIELPHGFGLAQRYGQQAVVHLQRVPFEYVSVRGAEGEPAVDLPHFEPKAIAEELARFVGTQAVAVMYGWTTIGEGRAMALAEARVNRK